MNSVLTANAPTRSEHLRAVKVALSEYVESGEHRLADRFHPGEGLMDKAERAYNKLMRHKQALRAANDGANKARADEGAEVRAWIIAHCSDLICRRGVAHLVRQRMVLAGLKQLSDVTIRRHLREIRSGQGRG